MSAHPFASIKRELKGRSYFDLGALNDGRVAKLPVCVRVLLEGAIRNCDEFLVKKADVEKIIDWKNTRGAVEIPFRPGRVLLQDFTGVPCVVDLAAMRDAVVGLGGQPSAINPQIPVELVIDHSVQVDATRSVEAREVNEAKEFERNAERFKFLKWGSTAFQKLKIVPPGNGIVHQVNLEYLARVAFDDEGMLYPDSVVGTDSHTTMVNGLGVLGWGVGGIEAEAAMLGQPISMLLPHVVGFKLTGSMPAGATATDVVLTVTAMLRKVGVVGKLVEFYGEGVKTLSLADRATISNMAPEYGATCGLFPVDETTLAYMVQTGRSQEHVDIVRDYLKSVGIFVDYAAENQAEYSQVVDLDLSTVVPCIAGPKRPQDYVAVKDQKEDFAACLAAPAGAKGFGMTDELRAAKTSVTSQGAEYSITNGSVVIASITSCTNTSNPSVLIAAGLVAQRAQAKGLKVAPYIKTSLSPGSQVVESYLRACGLLEPLAQQGFAIAGYGCMTCIGNSGELYEGVSEAIQKSGIAAAAVLSGNRNFEGRVHPDTVANYLASPPLVVAYALAGTMNINLLEEPLGQGADGPVFLKDVWPTKDEIEALIATHVTPDMFSSVYQRILEGNQRWDALKVPTSDDGRYHWDESSTYIHRPPFFDNFSATPAARGDVKDACCLLLLGDSITTDHISPAGSIHKTSDAAKFLTERGVQKADFNTYGARRGNDLIMARGTFGNMRLSNRLVSAAGTTGPVTIHIPTGEQMSVYSAAQRYIADGVPTIVLAGKEYGSGSSRDWAAKGPYLQGVKAVIAESFERIHRSNLIGMGVVPLCFKEGESAATHGLRGNERFSIAFGSDMKPGCDITVTADGKSFTAKLRIDTDAEMSYYRHGGILQNVVRKLAGVA